MSKEEVKYYQIAKYKKFANERYKHMSEINLASNIKNFGKSKRGTKYYHLIEYDETNPYNLLNEPKILAEVNSRFKTKAGDKDRVLTNLLSSQACCFNLFSPLKELENTALTNKLFSKLLNKEVTVTRIDIEFTPSKEESLGDQSKIGGTDADLAVFFDFGKNKKGLILLEFKYIESEFSRCTSYKKKEGIRETCNNLNFYTKHAEQAKESNRPHCGYMQYENWELTKKSQVLDHKIILESPSCPFIFSLNQLWRNMLLAEKVAKINEIDEFHFWVLCPEKNLALWSNNAENIYTDFRNILTEKGKLAFRKLDIENDFVKFIEENANTEWTKEWIMKFREKYIK